MKRILMALVLALAAIAAIGTIASAADTTGNGAPSGAHYNLNIIGVPKDKPADFSGGDGHRIFVDLGSKGTAANTKILLAPGEYGVLDANGTDGTASFQLPVPDADADGITSYSVYVRALGKPGGKAVMQSCYTDDLTTETWCAANFVGGVEPITIERQNVKGKSTFENVSKDLLYVDACTNYDATTDTCLAWDQVPLFSDLLDQYFWSYDNFGLKLAQFRFYDIPTETPWGN